MNQNSRNAWTALILLSLLAAVEAQKYVLEIPQSFLDEMITREQFNPGREFWHPALTVRKVAVAAPLTAKEPASEKRHLRSFLELTAASSSDTTTLEFVTTDGSDATTVLESASGQKLACECRFVRDYSSDSTTTTSSSTSTTSTTAAFIQKSPSAQRIPGSGIFMQESSQTRKARRSSPAANTDTQTDVVNRNSGKVVEAAEIKQPAVSNTGFQQQQQKSASDAEILDQLSTLLKKESQNQRDSVADYSREYNYPKNQRDDRMNGLQYQPQMQQQDNSNDFFEFVNQYEQYQRSGNQYYDNRNQYNSMYQGMNSPLQREAPRNYDSFNQQPNYRSGNYRRAGDLRDTKVDELASALLTVLNN